MCMQIEGGWGGGGGGGEAVAEHLTSGMDSKMAAITMAKVNSATLYMECPSCKRGEGRQTLSPCSPERDHQHDPEFPWTYITSPSPYITPEQTFLHR